jgi:PKD repeat protein
MKSIVSVQKRRLLLFTFLLIAAVAFALLLSGGSLGFMDRSALAASPSGGTVSPASPVATYTGGPFLGINQTNQADNAAITCTPVTPCDDYALAISLPTGDPNTYVFKVTVSWTDKATPTSAHNDFDVYVYNANGSVVSGNSGATSANPENVTISVTGGSYMIRVLPFDVNTGTGGDTYTATVALSAVPGAPAFPPPPAPVPGVPRYQNYAATNGLGTTAGEPSIGVNWATGKTIMASNTQTLRVTFDDSCSSSAKTTWEDVSAPNALTSLDPILFTDHNGLANDRTFTSQLTGQDSLSAFTDDDGESWTPSQGGGIPSGVDHQTIGGGPYRTDMSALPPVVPPPHPLYPNAIYYCSQDAVVSFCARSDDGGLTFGAGIPIYNTTQCGGIHGHVKVAPDGTVYVPDKSCGGKQGFTVSKDNGITWTVVTNPSSINTPRLVDPSIGIGKNGTVYFAYESGADATGSFPAKVAVARRNADGTYTWSNDQILGGEFAIKNAVFPAAISSAFNPSAVDADDNRAAVAFLGSTAPGDYTNTSFPGSWHLFVSTTLDGGVTWTTVDATPNDPVQRGSICTLGTVDCDHVPDDRNLLDFMDATIDRQGRVLVGYADGCIGGCVNGTENSFTELATIARQSGGKRIVSAFDPVEPALAGSPIVTAFSDQSGIHLSWQAPDNGGSAISGYKVYRRPESSAQKTLIANLGAQTTFDDFTAAPGVTYFYSVSTVNAFGEGPVCDEVTPVPLPPVTSCTIPGASLVEDPASDATPANAGLDIRELSVAEPFDPANPNASKLVWTFKVDSLAIVPANSQWYIIWDFGKGLRKYVAMKTDVTGAPSYEYGHIGPPLSPTSPDPDANKPFPEGAADSGSISADGTITITISNSKIADSTFKGVGAPKRGSTLANISPRTFSGTGNTNVTGSTATDSTTGTPSYTLVGNNFCRPQTAPTAVLSASPLSGSAPLIVNFNGSASSDPDAGDAIASYTFDFGDTYFITQSSPTISHTYTSNGVYTAKLYVTDTRGRVSNSPASVTITVSASPTPTPTPVVSCIEDNDSRIAYSNGWHAVNLAAASAGHFRYHSGSGSSHSAKLAFNVPAGNTGAISYSFAKSTKGGSADVYLDGVFKETISYAGSVGSTQMPEFKPQYKVQYTGLAAGAHNLEIRNMSGVVYVDAFCLDNSSSSAQPTSGPGNTTNQSGSVSGGQTSSTNYAMPSGAKELSVVVESNVNVPFKLLLVNPSGLTLQTIDASNGVAVIDTPITQGGTYVIKVVNVSVGPLQFTTTATPLVMR